ncbi:hypothetical protein [Roseibium sp. RKSG952]|uniref:hypothetical protein n=1 Tax=Roseibium sp. RKSG952 TaxID=2529384 RepID=UPI0012BCFAE3|nr:hypothetical protein [Roseibium sp. RKSG952]
MNVENGMYDPKELEVKKVTSREADQRAVDSVRLSEEDLCKRNGLFECFDASKNKVIKHIDYDFSQFEASHEDE